MSRFTESMLTESAAGGRRPTSQAPAAPPAPPSRYSEGMWEALWLLGATPEGLASELPDLSLLEIAAELKKAEYRVKQRRCHERELARLYEPVVEDRLEAAVNNQLRSGFASRVPA